MTTYLLSVDVKRSVIIDGTEVEKNVLVCPSCRDFNVALVPDAGNEVGVLNAREAALRAEGNGYLAVEAFALAPAFLGSCLTEVETIAPSAVEVHPVGTLELRTWILAARKVRSLNDAAKGEQQSRRHKQFAEVFHTFYLL